MLHKKTSKIKIWSLILCACVLLSCLPFSAFAGGGDEAACDVSGCTGYYENGFCTADGTHYQAATLNADDYYEIGNAGQLYWFGAKVNGGDNAINGKLTANITVNPGTFDASGAYVPKGGEEARTWTPIGKQSRSYHHATFDGNGKTISGLYYNGDDKHVGLFGFTGSGAMVQNLGIVNSAFVVTRQASDGNASVGSFVGYIDAYTTGITISNCYSSAYIVGSTVGYPCHAGGLVGYVNAESGHTITLSNCYNTGSVSANSESNDVSVGGLIGDATAYGTLVVSNCYNTGSVTGSGRYVDAGGVVGYVVLDSNVVIVQACYNTGNVAAFGNTCDAGGITGSDKRNKVSATDCYYLTGTASTGVGDGTDTAIAKSADEFASGSVAWLLNGEKTEGVWKQTLTGDNKMSTPGFTGDPVYYDTDSDTYYSTHNYVDGICTGCGEATEANWGTSKSNLTGSGTLEEAIAAAKNDSTIKYILLNKSWTATGDGTHYFITGDDLTFDLNGKTVSGPLTLRAYVGSITFTDSVGGGKWENTASDGSAVKVDYATATFTGGSYKGYNAVFVNDSFGIVVIKGGTFTGTYGMTNASGTATIEGGTFVGNYGAYLCSMSLSTTITGGDFSGCSTSVIYYSGTLDMSGYPVTSVTGTTPITELTVYNGSNVAAIVGTEVKLPSSYGFCMIGDEEHTIVTELAAYTTYAIEKVIPEANWGTSKSNLTGSGTLAEAVAAAKNDSTIKYIQLNKSWTDSRTDISYCPIEGGEFTFDLNGKTVSGPMIIQVAGGNVTFTDSVGGGMWECTNSDGNAVGVRNATVTFIGGSYKGDNAINVLPSGNVVVKGGTFESTGFYTVVVDGQSTGLTIEGGSFTGGEWASVAANGIVTIKGGSFASGDLGYIAYWDGTLDLSAYPTTTAAGTTPITELTVCNMSSATVTVGTDIKLPTDYGFYDTEDEAETIVTTLAENVTYAIKSTVIPEAKWGTDKDHLTGSGTLEEAVAAAYSDRTIGYILLNKSLTSTENFYHELYTNVLTFDLNGKTVSGPIGLRAVKGSFTFTDSVGGGKWENTAEGGYAVIVDRATVTIAGGSYKGTNAVYLSEGSAIVVIKGGTFTGIIFNYSGTATIEGGTFVGNFGACADSSSISTTVTGGDFSDCLYTVVYYGGVLDMSGYSTTTVAGTTPITELTVWNLASAAITVGTEVKLPTNYGFYKVGDTAQTIVTELAYNTNYAIKSTVIHEAKWGTSKSNLTGSGTLEEAIAAAENDNTIKYILINKSWTATGDEIHYYITGDGLTLDLNGKTVSGPLTLRASVGSITFTDSVGGGMWENTAEGASAVVVDDATATITGGSYKGGDAVYINYGTAVIKDGTFTSTEKYDVTNSEGTLTVEGGVFVGENAVVAGDGSQATTIKGGDFSGCSFPLVYWGGTLDLSGYPTATVAGTTPITELTVYNGASDTATVGTEVKLPSGYGFYQVGDTAQTVVTELATYTDYAVKFVGDTVSVTITWTSMEFTYTDGAWNPDKHGYDEGTWTTSGGTVTVENNGNAEVTVSFDYTALLDGIDGEFDKASFDLLENESNTTSLTIVGKPSEGLDNERIGTVTVCIAKKVQAATD